ncbi:MAG: hypothetical protein M9951_10750 [Burkholderiaceae bacterium]|nr:hypothetical protein [Burkholderiaceae bacterium]
MASAALVACGGGGGGSASGGSGTSLDLIGTSVDGSGINATIPPKATNVGDADSPAGSAVDPGPTDTSKDSSSSSSPSLGAQGGSPSSAQTDFLARPFAADSPWNQPIPSNATYRSSDPRTTSLRSSSPFGVNTSNWTIWVWHAKATDPTVTINVSVRHLTSSGNANAGDVTIRMPVDAHPDPANDSHMVVIDPDGKHAHEFWYVKKGGSSYTAVSYAKVPLDGSGVNISGYAAHNPDYFTYGWGATRAYGGSQLGGLIRKGEATQGPIEHAIAVAIPARYLGGRAVWPATSDDQSSDYAGVIPMGTRFAIPPDINLDSLGLSPAHLRLARALQKYGLIVVDKSGSPCMYAEGLEAQADGHALNANRSQMALIHSLLTVVE